MSRYLLLLLINLPFIAAGLLSAITRYKLGKSSFRRFGAQLIIWSTILLGLVLAEPIYTWLFSNQLTETEPLSLFDVVQITGLVIVFYIANRSRSRVETLERRVQDLHQELSIQLNKL